MDKELARGISPEYLAILLGVAGKYLGSAGLGDALRRGATNLMATYSEEALQMRMGTRQEWGFAPEGYVVSVTNGCNLDCKYCYYSVGSGGQPTYIDMDKLHIILEEMKQKFGIRFVTLTGGETTLCLHEIARRNPDITFYAYTNGIKLTAEYCQELESLGNVIIALTVIGDKIVHDSIRGDGNYNKVMRAVENLRRSQLIWGFSLTESRANYHQIVDGRLLDELMAFEPYYFRMIPFMPAGREGDCLALTWDEFDRIAEVIREKKTAGALIHDYINDPTSGLPCLAGESKSFLITEEFRLCPCVFMDTFTDPLQFVDGQSNLTDVLRTHRYFQNAREQADQHPRCIILDNPHWRRDITASR
ncbi:MAG: radical SAM protein [bacterium]